MRALRAELSKLLSLPFAWLAVGAGLVVPVGISIITSLTSEPGPDTGFSELGVGVVGAIILGLSAIGSEYTTPEAAHTSHTARPGIRPEPSPS